MDLAEKRQRITMIDDHSAMLEIVSEVLEPDGYAVTALSGDRTAVEDVAATKPDLIILDLVFNGHRDQLSGWEYLRLIRSHRDLQRLPVLICSGDVRNLRDRADELAEDSRLGVLEKPFTIDQLQAKVSAMLTNGVHSVRGTRNGREPEQELVAEA